MVLVVELFEFCLPNPHLDVVGVLGVKGVLGSPSPVQIPLVESIDFCDELDFVLEFVLDFLRISDMLGKDPKEERRLDNFLPVPPFFRTTSGVP